MYSSVSLGFGQGQNVRIRHLEATLRGPEEDPTLAKQAAKAVCKLHLEGIGPHRGLAPPRRKNLVRDVVVLRTLMSRNLIPNIFRKQLRNENAEIQKFIFTSLKSPTNYVMYDHYEYDFATEDCLATLVEIADELGDPPFGQLIAFSVLPLASLNFGSLGGTVLLRGTDRRPADCSFPRLLFHFLQGFAYWNEGRLMSFQRLAKLNSAIRMIAFLVLFSPICSILRLSVHASNKTSNT
uniref:Uncharacterized protein n=1 Tax=Solanum tuberosum TaxID=4113 RepID=M1DSZ3_SOLTU